MGTDASFDIVTSIGCGKADKTQPAPTSTFVISGWVEELFKTLIETMNGHKAWEKFYDGSGNDMLDRCERLNVRLKDEIEPELDNVSAISRLEDLAKSYCFHYQPSKGQFSSISGRVEEDGLTVLANRHKASLYFFELMSITHIDEVAIVKGWICCRLRPGRESQKRLIGQTSHFKIRGQTVNMPQLQKEERLMLEVSFQQQVSQNSDPLRIDVKFDRVEYYISISGFPMTLQVSLLFRC